MKNIFLLFVLFSICLYSQNKKSFSSKDFNDKIIDFAIENCENKFIELPDLYDCTVNKISDDKNEKIILAEKLKNRGFNVTDWGRGNNPPFGSRIITVTLKKGIFECEVVKNYYSTTNESEYIVTEKIRCRKVQK